jgi:hypothetical protein
MATGVGGIGVSHFISGAPRAAAAVGHFSKQKDRVSGGPPLFLVTTVAVVVS